VKPRKVVLIAPPNDFAGNVNVVQLTTLLAPPLGILSVSSYLAAHDVPVELIDVQMDFGFGLTRAAEHAVSRRVAQHLRAQADDIAWVGISQLSNAGTGIALAGEIRAALPDMPIVFGGYFPSSTYRLLLEKYPFITAIVRGDGEAAALQISRRLARGQPFLSDETPGLAWRDGEQIRTTPSQPMNPDDLPLLDFRLLRHPDCYQLIDLMTSYGCPFQCSYCLEGGMRPYAAHSPARVARQLTHLEAELPNDRVFIYDPVFGLGRERTLELCRVMGGHRFTYAVESRVDVLAPDLIPPLRAAGVETIYWGIESASASTLLRMNKVRSEAKAESYVRSAVEALRACFENGVTPVMGFMLGFPGDTEADYQATLEFVQGLRRLHDQVTPADAEGPGFVLYALYTKVYDGSPLVDQVAAFPDVVLHPEPFIGEQTVWSPSPGLDLDVTRRYQAEVTSQSAYTSLALERVGRYYTFSMAAFLADHPALQDEQGVVVLGDSLRRFAPEFVPASMVMRYDKSAG